MAAGTLDARSRKFVIPWLERIIHLSKAQAGHAASVQRDTSLASDRTGVGTEDVKYVSHRYGLMMPMHSTHS